MHRAKVLFFSLLELREFCLNFATMDHGISYEAILVAFADDDSISDNCDPENEDKTPTGVAINVYNKLIDCQLVVDGVFKVIENNGEAIGFVGVNKKHRNKEVLTNLFESIKEWLGGDFITFMWKRNQRAINWFKKCGMVEDDVNADSFVKLKYESCH